MKIQINELESYEWKVPEIITLNELEVVLSRLKKLLNLRDELIEITPRLHHIGGSRSKFSPEIRQQIVKEYDSLPHGGRGELAKKYNLTKIQLGNNVRNWRNKNETKKEI